MDYGEWNPCLIAVARKHIDREYFWTFSQLYFYLIFRSMCSDLVYVILFPQVSAITYEQPHRDPFMSTISSSHLKHVKTFHAHFHLAKRLFAKILVMHDNEHVIELSKAKQGQALCSNLNDRTISRCSLILMIFWADSFLWELCVKFLLWAFIYVFVRSLTSVLLNFASSFNKTSLKFSCDFQL